MRAIASTDGMHTEDPRGFRPRASGRVPRGNRPFVLLPVRIPGAPGAALLREENPRAPGLPYTARYGREVRCPYRVPCASAQRRRESRSEAGASHFLRSGIEYARDDIGHPAPLAGFLL